MLYENHPLYYLIKIDSYQSISLAAENLHISQPALSQAMKSLEKSLDLTLLDRTYRGVNLTDDGKKVVELAKKAFEYFEQIENLAQQKYSASTDEITLNDLTVYTNPAYSRLILPTLLKEYRSHNTAKTLQFQNLTPEMKTEDLTANDPNVVVLGILRENTRLPDYATMTVLNKSKSYIMCSKDFPLIPPEKTSISFKELVNMPFVLTKNSFNFQDTLFDILKLYGEPIIKAISPDHSGCTYMVENSMGVSFTNKLTVYSKNENIRYLAIRNAPKFLLALVYNKNADEKKVNKLAELIKMYL